MFRETFGERLAAMWREHPAEIDVLLPVTERCLDSIEPMPVLIGSALGVATMMLLLVWISDAFALASSPSMLAILSVSVLQKALMLSFSISELALLTNEMTACLDGRSTEAYCQLRPE